MTSNKTAQRANAVTTPNRGTPAAPIHPTDSHSRHDTHVWPAVGGGTLDPGHATPESHCGSAGVDPSATDSQRVYDTHSGAAVGGALAANHPTIGDSTPSPLTSDGWLELRIWAEMFDDAQKARIANVNRAERGGADPDIFHAHIERLKAVEHECRLNMVRTMRRVVPPSVRNWQKATNGIGEPLLARLLGHLGHPVWATPHHWEGAGSSRVLITDPPFERTVGQLWQFCGHGAPARRTKGMTAEQLAAHGSPTLKMLVHLNAESCMKTMTSPYRLVYERVRQDVADKDHTAVCVRCGPSGKPAQPGSPWSPGHQHAHALRIVGKEILRDLWMVSP